MADGAARRCLLADVGHEGQLPGALDGRLQRPLMCGADTRDPPRLDLLPRSGMNGASSFFTSL